MPRSVLLKLLLYPSLLSSIIAFCIASTVVAFANWPFAINDPVISSYFFGPQGLVERLRGSNDLAALLFPADSITYTIGLGVIALLAGTIVYIILESIDKSILGIASAYASIHDADSRSKKSVEKEITYRIGIRILSLCLWSFYCFAFFNVILPVCIITTRLPLDQLGISNSLLAIGGFALLLLALHIHVILIRCISLRPRLFRLREALLAYNK